LLEYAKVREITTACFSGSGGGKCGKMAEISIEIPSSDTARIQECYMIIGHTVCEIIENIKFKK
jgi:D-sedoheptulose 7-phosphate isomerase